MFFAASSPVTDFSLRVSISSPISSARALVNASFPFPPPCQDLFQVLLQYGVSLSCCLCGERGDGSWISCLGVAVIWAHGTTWPPHIASNCFPPLHPPTPSAPSHTKLRGEAGLECDPLPSVSSADRSDSQSEEWGTTGENHQQPPPLCHPVALHPAGISQHLAASSRPPRRPPASFLAAFVSFLHTRGTGDVGGNARA